MSWTAMTKDRFAGEQAGHSGSTASGHLLGRAPCGLPRVLRDGKGLRVLAALPLNGFSFVLLK